MLCCFTYYYVSLINPAHNTQKTLKLNRVSKMEIQFLFSSNSGRAHDLHRAFGPQQRTQSDQSRNNSQNNRNTWREGEKVMVSTENQRKTIDFTLKTIDFQLKIVNFTLKTIDFTLKSVENLPHMTKKSFHGTEKPMGSWENNTRWALMVQPRAMPMSSPSRTDDSTMINDSCSWKSKKKL